MARWGKSQDANNWHRIHRQKVTHVQGNSILLIDFTYNLFFSFVDKLSKSTFYVFSGIMFYTVGKELFSKQSPGGVYNQALKLCKKNDEVIDYLGEPITGHGTSGSRRRRQIVK